MNAEGGESLYRGEAVCSPTGFGLCSTHPACEYTQIAQRELWAKTEAAEKRVKRWREEIRLSIEAIRYGAMVTAVRKLEMLLGES